MNDFGFISKFDIEPSKAKQVVRALYDLGINHFELYDCMERYEKPLPDKKEWRDPLGRLVRADTLEAYLSEINRLGGKSWFYTGVYSVSVNYSEPFLLKDGLFTYNNEKFVQDWFCLDNDSSKPFLSIMNPSSRAWKENYSKELRKVLKFGFSGIFFDQFGSLKNRFDYKYKLDDWSFDNEKNAEYFQKINRLDLITDFLRYFKNNNPKVDFLFNAVDGYGFDETKHLVYFPFIEVWNDYYLKEYCSRLKDSGKFVIAYYTPLKDGKFNFELFDSRKKFINSQGGSYLFRGDDNRFLIDCYFPNAIKI